MGKVNHRALVGDLHLSPPFQGRKADEQVAGSIPFILVVIFGDMAWLWRQGQTGFFRLLLTALVKADKGTLGVVGLVVNGQHIFHGADERGTFLFRNTPLLFQPGLKFFF